MGMTSIQTPKVRHWEEAGIVVGVLLIALNVWALFTGFWAGPLFHPLLIFVGAILVYMCALPLAGATRDSTEIDY